MKQLTKIIWVIVLLVWFLINQHLMDMSNNAQDTYDLIVGDVDYPICELRDMGTTNGFMDNGGRQLYHITWYSNYLIIFLFTFICIKHIIDKGGN